MSFTISFAELDHIVELPPSAQKHPAWWASLAACLRLDRFAENTGHSIDTSGELREN
jgi:hypothetical protein